VRTSSAWWSPRPTTSRRSRVWPVR
jgi:hypothetical protein